MLDINLVAVAVVGNARVPSIGSPIPAQVHNMKMGINTRCSDFWLNATSINMHTHTDTHSYAHQLPPPPPSPPPPSHTINTFSQTMAVAVTVLLLF